MSKLKEHDKKFDLILPIEIERKFIPRYAGDLVSVRHHETSTSIEQIYLSSPEEPFSLRLREYANEQGVLEYEATLKDRGEIMSDGLRRIEVSTPITADFYEFYKNSSTPVLKKIRAEPVPDVTVDFFEDGTVLVEAEDQNQWQEFVALYGDDFTEVTGSALADSEQRAHTAFEHLHGRKALEPQPEVTAGGVLKDVLEARNAEPSPTIVHIGGRSGSGKSTIVRDLVSGLRALEVSSSLLSTDDYHRGAAWLRNYNNGEPWSHWDDPIVYNLADVRQDLLDLKSGTAVAKREIDWSLVESRSSTLLYPAEVIIIEGIYATDPGITEEDDLTYVLNTPLATCIGRRLLRDIKERPQFSNPAESLLYMLTEAEPAYRQQHRLVS